MVGIAMRQLFSHRQTGDRAIEIELTGIVDRVLQPLISGGLHDRVMKIAIGLQPQLFISGTQREAAAGGDVERPSDGSKRARMPGLSGLPRFARATLK